MGGGWMLLLIALACGPEDSGTVREPDPDTGAAVDTADTGTPVDTDSDSDTDPDTDPDTDTAIEQGDLVWEGGWATGPVWHFAAGDWPEFIPDLHCREEWSCELCLAWPQDGHVFVQWFATTSGGGTPVIDHTYRVAPHSWQAASETRDFGQVYEVGPGDDAVLAEPVPVAPWEVYPSDPETHASADGDRVLVTHSQTMTLAPGCDGWPAE